MERLQEAFGHQSALLQPVRVPEFQARIEALGPPSAGMYDGCSSGTPLVLACAMTCCRVPKSDGSANVLICNLLPKVSGCRGTAIWAGSRSRDGSTALAMGCPRPRPA